MNGVQKKHLGPRLEYAAIELKVEPSDCFEVDFSDRLKNINDESKELLDAAVYGILDVILTHLIQPLRNIKINILSANIHPVDSNKMAFRKAGRNAGKKILESIA